MQPPAEPQTVARLMGEYRAGSNDAASQLVQILYPELRRLAAARMKGERADHTWQPTALVNELYLELVKIKALRAGNLDEDGRAAFLGLAAHIMKRLLIHHARPLYREIHKVPTDFLTNVGEANPEDMLLVENLMDRLASINPKLRTVVEMKVFQGMTMPEIAGRLGCAKSTADRYWCFARKFLEDNLDKGELE